MQKHNIVLSALEEDLLTLLDNQELYGLEILDAINYASQGTRKLRTGSLYTTLRRMETKNFVTSRWGDNTDSGARRKYYKVSAKGKHILQETQEYRVRLSEWGQLNTQRTPQSTIPRRPTVKYKKY